MEPTCGRIVHYHLSAEDVVAVNRRRDDARQNRAKHQADALGYQAHVGNQPGKGDIVPLLIVRVWPDEYKHGAPGEWIDGQWNAWELLSTFGVNGQAFLDGNDSLWVTSASQGDKPGQWNWPPKA